ncbi:MAG: hypothetical protein HC905_26085 [Bacteroidales bacterium]|nr:hypothetical protein [Bacteroidales bacterium]
MKTRIYIVIALCYFVFQKGISQEDTIKSGILIEQYTLEDLLRTPIISAQKKDQAIEDIPASVTVLTKTDN